MSSFVLSTNICVFLLHLRHYARAEDSNEKRLGNTAATECVFWQKRSYNKGKQIMYNLSRASTKQGQGERLGVLLCGNRCLKGDNGEKGVAPIREDRRLDLGANLAHPKNIRDIGFITW